LRRSRSARLAVALAAWACVALVVACRAIAGIDGDLSYAPSKPDAARRDAGVDATVRDAAEDVERRRDAGGDGARRGDAATDAGHQDVRRDAGTDAPVDVRSDARDAGRSDDAHGDAGDAADVELPDASACPVALGEVVFSFDGGLGTILVSDASVYVEVVNPANNGSGYNDYESAPYSGLVACPKSGCASPTTLFDYSSPSAPVQWGGAGLGPAGVYFSRSSVNVFTDGGREAGSISVEPFDGGPSTEIIGRLGAPFLVAVSGGTLYWVDDPNTLTTLPDGGLWRVFRCGLPGCAAPEVLMAGGGQSIDTAYTLFVDPGRAYLTAYGSAQTTLYACNLDGGCDGGPAELLTDLLLPGNAYPGDPLTGGDGVISDGEFIYWSSGAYLTIRRLSRQTGALLDELASPGLTPTSIAIDATYVYWVLQQNGFVQRTRKDGAWHGATQNVVCGAAGITSIAVDQTSLYYEVVAGGATILYRAPLPAP
jgi:hypothetical protein